MQATKYRADIDGIRSIAVLSVLFFHADIPPFTGGFVGVDVFFVISGFLITNLILTEIHKGVFSLKDFYLRRMRRLLPALLFTCACSLIAAHLLFISEHYKLFGGEITASVFSFSNIYFWQKANYFDTEDIFKPLLHTWSLSVEEQFYLFWPFTLLLLLKFKRSLVLSIAIFILFVVSITLNLIFLEYHSAIFYLIPFRVFEFCIGAITVFIIKKQPRNNLLLEPILLLGLALIAYSVFAYDKSTVFPSLNALAPCIGAALVIYSGASARYSSVLIKNRVFVSIGLISYSLYLIHWPLIVFYSYYNFDPLQTTEKWGILFFSFFAATAMYRWVEQPFRNGSLAKSISRRLFFGSCLSIVILLGYVGQVIENRNGFPKRKSFVPISNEFSKAQEYPFCKDGYGICDSDSVNIGRKPDVAIIGDSTTNASAYLFAAIAAQNKLLVKKETAVGCIAVFDNGKPCAEEINGGLNNLIKQDIKQVMLVNYWDYSFEKETQDFLFKRLAETISRFRDAGIKIYVFGAMPKMFRDPASCFGRPIAPACNEWITLQDPEKQHVFNQRLKKVVLDSGASYLDIFDLTCKEKVCRVAYEGRSMYGDRFHFQKYAFGGYVFLQRGLPEKIGFDDIFTKHHQAIP